MADGLLAGGGLGSEAMARDHERTGWAVEEELAPFGKGLFEDEDSYSDCSNHDKPAPILIAFNLFVADCKASEVKEFTAEFLEKVLEPSGWRAVWHTNVFKVLVEVTDVDYAALKAVVRLADPYLCESQVSTFTLECMKELLDLKEHQLPLQELWVVFDDSGVFDQTALAIEHIRDKLCPEPCKEEIEIQFHSDPLSAINTCYEGDTVIVCPGHYVVHGTFSIADSIELEGIEIYPGSKCTLSDNGIHHCKEGILIKDFLDEHYDIPKISMVNNVIHNNEGYGVVLVKPTIFSDLQENAQDETEENKALKVQTSGEADVAERVDLEELIECATGKMELYARADLSEQVEGNCEIVNELVAASTQKGQLKKKRLSELGITLADDNLMSQEMFVSIVGNQFKWNGKGSFGTFLF
eukprot:bmy_20555T0